MPEIVSVGLTLSVLPAHRLAQEAWGLEVDLSYHPDPVRDTPVNVECL